MNRATYFLTRSDTGAVTGGGYTPDGTLPPNAVPCTADQAKQARYASVQGQSVIIGKPTAPSLPEQAARASLAGLTVTLTGSVNLTTLFPTDVTTQRKIPVVMQALAETGKFPNGEATYPMKDATGQWHTFNPLVYKAVALALLSYVSACDLIASGNPLNATALPPDSVSLNV